MTEEAKKPLRLDIGCGKNKKPEFFGVDRISFPGVDLVLDVAAPTAEGFARWPWEDGSVDSIFTSHFVEHLKQDQRIHFFNEVNRVLVPKGKIEIIVPFHASGRAYGDLTHEWPPVVEFFFFYLNREWRKVNAPHLDVEFNPRGFDCDLRGTWGYNVGPPFNLRHAEVQQFAITHYRESASDLMATLTKE